MKKSDYIGDSTHSLYGQWGALAKGDNLCKNTLHFLSYCIPYLSLSHSFLWLL